MAFRRVGQHFPVRRRRGVGFGCPMLVSHWPLGRCQIYSHVHLELTQNILHHALCQF